MFDRRLAGIGAGVIVASALLSGCTNDSLVQQTGLDNNNGFVEGDGQVTEYPAAQRSKTVTFTTTLLDGSERTQKDYSGKVLVVNFWYASCPPCRSEAPDLEKISSAASDSASFLGVDVHDSVDTAKSFVRTYGIGYDNTSDIQTGAVQLAFAGERGPNSTPATLILDKKGRVASRILGQVDPSTLKSLIASAAGIRVRDLDTAPSS